MNHVKNNNVVEKMNLSGGSISSHHYKFCCSSDSEQENDVTLENLNYVIYMYALCIAGELVLIVADTLAMGSHMAKAEDHMDETHSPNSGDTKESN